MPGHSDGLLPPSDARAHNAMPQLLVLGGAGMTAGRAVDVQELSGCKESHCTRRLVASRDEKPGPWVYFPILLHLEGLLGVFSGGRCIPASGLSLDQATQFAESRAKAREAAEVRKAI